MHDAHQRRIWRRYGLLFVVLGGTILGLFALFTPSYLPTGEDATTEANQSTPAPVSSATTLSPSSTPRPVLSKVNARILMYHYIRDGIDPAQDQLGYNLSISPQLLREQLTKLTEAGYKPISWDDALAGKGTNKSVILTFDDGYEDFYTNAFPILKELKWPATLYMVSGFIGKPGYMTADQIKEIHASGITIGAHTVGHRDLSKLDLTGQTFEIIKSKEKLQQLIGEPVTTFAYPAGKFNDESLHVVFTGGFSSAVTTISGIASKYDNQFLLPRIRITPNISPDRLVQLLK